MIGSVSNKVVGSGSLKASKQVNPYSSKDYESKEDYEYISNGSSENRGFASGQRPTDSGKITSNSHLRSTLPLNPFYGKFIEQIKARNIRLVKETLTKNPIKFYQPIDEMNKTALHCACEKNSLEMVKAVIEILYEEAPINMTNGRKSMKTISKMDFINMQNNDGLTAIHYAAFRGNIRILEFLIKNGGNPFIKDNDGHNVIHIAAQGDKVNVIHFFIKNYNFDVNDRDSKDSSALHWAAYLNKEIALTYLIAWGANVNAQDAERNAPLHLAVLTSEKVQETR